MMSPILVLFVFWYASIATLLSILIGFLSRPRLRIALPWICGMVIAYFTIVINPQFEWGSAGTPFYLSMFCGPLTVPLFIVVSLELIKQNRETRFGKPAVFIGSLITLSLYFLLTQSGFHIPVRPWQLESFIGLGVLMFIAIIVFYWTNYFGQEWAGSQNSLPEKPEHNVYWNKKSGSMKTFAITLLCLIVLCSPNPLFMYYSRSSSVCQEYYVYEITESTVSGGTVLHLTEDDFNQFPRLQPVIRDGRYSDAYCDRYTRSLGAGGTCRGIVAPLCSEAKAFRRYGNEPDTRASDFRNYVFLEYGGKYYYLVRSSIVS